MGDNPQEKAPSGSLFLSKEEKASFAVAIAKSLTADGALSMLVQSTVMAEAESRRQHKAEQKKQAQEEAEGIMAVQQWERDNPCPEGRPQEVYFDCQLVTTGMQEASEAEAEQQEWHEVQDMPQEHVPRLFKWEQEKQAKQKLQQKVGQVTVDQGQGYQTEGAAKIRQGTAAEAKQYREGKDWSKVKQAAEMAANPGGKFKKACRHLLNKIQEWGVQAHGNRWEQLVGVHWHMVCEQQALSWVYGGVEADSDAFLTPELQQQGGDRALYETRRAEAKTERSKQQTVMPNGVETLKVTQAMGEHMELLCREARGVAAAATEEGAEEALKQVVQGIMEMVATPEKGQQLQEAAAEAAYLRAAVLWHKLHAHADGLMIGDARQVKKAEESRTQEERQGTAAGSTG